MPPANLPLDSPFSHFFFFLSKIFQNDCNSRQSHCFPFWSCVFLFFPSFGCLPDKLRVLLRGLSCEQWPPFPGHPKHLQRHWWLLPREPWGGILILRPFGFKKEALHMLTGSNTSKWPAQWRRFAISTTWETSSGVLRGMESRCSFLSFSFFFQ